MSPYCTHCGSEVEQSWNACPNCGISLRETIVPQLQPQQPSQISRPPQTTQAPSYPQKFTSGGNNNYGTAAIIAAVIGLFCGTLYVAPVLGFAAIILGGLGISRDDNSAIAVIGLLLGILNIVCFIIFYFLLSQLFNWLNWFDFFW